MVEKSGARCDVTTEEDWFDQYNTEKNFDMDACFNAFDKDG
jgi:hypothetical protein